LGRQPLFLIQDHRRSRGRVLCRVSLEDVKQSPHQRKCDNYQEEQADAEIRDPAKTDHVLFVALLERNKALFVSSRSHTNQCPFPCSTADSKNGSFATASGRFASSEKNAHSQMPPTAMGATKSKASTCNVPCSAPGTLIRGLGPIR